MRIRVLARDCLPKKAEGTTERSSAEEVSARNPQRISPLRSAYGRQAHRSVPVPAPLINTGRYVIPNTSRARKKRLVFVVNVGMGTEACDS
ncbi:hypothetical protein NDU88_004377 [Pleurodeles waltl]|uniref:Uncharacterized protein n=1 Tax=Pleurodeles waltl TaxID=8319 RepID=A0AAV7TSD7_PLEWA|nr:hypothetical protein NDU88_004377 [Pleurodeles waltl]